MWKPSKQREYKIIGRVRFVYNGQKRTVGVVEDYPITHTLSGRTGPRDLSRDRLITGYEFGKDAADTVSGRHGPPIKSFTKSKMSNVVWE